MIKYYDNKNIWDNEREIPRILTSAVDEGEYSTSWLGGFTPGEVPWLHVA
jgi:hypothetical protein